jgi:hypothetical protein
MTNKIPPPAPKPALPHGAKPHDSGHPVPATEPIEVLGRHKNDGQKDHKGAR